VWPLKMCSKTREPKDDAFQDGALLDDNVDDDAVPVVRVEPGAAQDDAAAREADEQFRSEFDRFFADCVASRAVEPAPKTAPLADLHVPPMLKLKKHARFGSQPVSGPVSWNNGVFLQKTRPMTSSR